ncbi:hypothetical protein PF010_g15926 [Phytophthora fragariae]|uniref:Uncharacterized protein n=1 Tax=Phytophthora fragariae TaxID=53985 RepID=A0A6G0KTH1_9STRA|nr:hypothetical protein PF010_g15926 [Phytophthora fragariae]KAE9223137.1 hypothetical protein PF004_g12605 [Phytophthora fragariae]
MEPPLRQDAAAAAEPRSPLRSAEEPKSRIGRQKGRNFEAGEEIQLCNAYLSIGKDSSVGPGQSAAKFWERLTNYYNEHRPAGADH